MQTAETTGRRLIAVGRRFKNETHVAMVRRDSGTVRGEQDGLAPSDQDGGVGSTPAPRFDPFARPRGLALLRARARVRPLPEPIDRASRVLAEWHAPRIREELIEAMALQYLSSPFRFVMPFAAWIERAGIADA